MAELLTGKKLRERGQAMVEYALILVLLAIAFGIAIAATGPAIGNVFCNVVDNIGGSTASPQGGNCGSTAPDLAGTEGGAPNLFWQTVTWVAQNPQGETPFPTPIHRAPTSVSGGGRTNTPTLTTTPTPSNTPTNTITPTPTNSLTPSPGPSPTSTDSVYTIPFVDQANNINAWRLDTGTMINAGNWTVQWYDAEANSANAGGWRNINLSTPEILNPSISTDINGLNFNWAAGFPAGSGITNGDTWGGVFNGTFTAIQAGVYRFTIAADDFANVYVDGSANPVAWSNGTSSVDIPLSAASHTIRVDYMENTGNASMQLTVARETANPDDTVTGSNSCPWGQQNVTTNAVSANFEFENYPGQSTWPAGLSTCYLELRGYVDTSGHAHPTLSFWDIWDFATATNATVQLQIADYTTDVSGNLIRPLNWGVAGHTITLHSTGSSNYNWTRDQIDLSSIAGLSTKVTFRFVIGSTAAQVTPFRWYIDDIQMLDNTSPGKTFTVGNTWNLNARSQMSDFIYDGDSFDNPANGITGNPRRWDLTSTHSHGGMAWDDSPAINDQGFIAPLAAQQRTHYIEFQYPVDLTNTRVPAVPTTDANGNTGTPVLTFWQSYDIGNGTSLHIQYTNNTNDLVPDTWTDVPSQGLLVNCAVAACTNLTENPIQVDLTQIPNWNTQAFRLRFALVINSGATLRDGWYIDDIAIGRTSSGNYPFVDDAESAIFTAANWDAIGPSGGNMWGSTTSVGGAVNSATAYTNCVAGGCATAETEYLQMHNSIDLLDDTPGSAARAAAVNPVLTFWHQRNVGKNVSLGVDLWVASTNTWTTVWQWPAIGSKSVTATAFKVQPDWERAEINLPDAIFTATGKTWANVTSNSDGVTNDDDIKIRFTYVNTGTIANGFYVDEIHIQDASTLTHKMWTAGGDGQYVDTIEGSTHVAFTWQQRWYTGGLWGSTSTAGFTRSGSQALTDTPSGNYNVPTLSILEMAPIIDLTSTPAGSYPTLSFWTRYSIGNAATFRVDIATENTAQTAQAYDQIGGWGAWTQQSLTAGGTAGTLTNTVALVTWQHASVNLTSFIGKRVRIRFVVSAPSGSTAKDGAYIDDVALTYSPTQIGVPFVDSAASTSNWIAEGIWGLGTNYFTGSGSTDLGPAPWVGTYYDCEPMVVAGDNCGSAATAMQDILTHNTDYPASHSPQNDVSNPAKIGPEIITDINYNWGSTLRPLNNTAPAGYNDTFVARWTRQVTLSPGTYSFATISDDGVNLWIDDNTSITGLLGPATASGGGATSRYVINDWGDHGPTFDYNTITVTSASPITRTLTLEYYENTGGAQIQLYATGGGSSSFTDSPNTVLANSLYPGDAGLISNGFFDLSGGTTPTLSYKLLYDLKTSSNFYVEISTDGGFTWTQIDSQGPGTCVLNGASMCDWQQRTLSLTGVLTTAALKQHVMFRFRLDTRSNTLASPTGDGVYVTDIHVNP